MERLETSPVFLPEEVNQAYPHHRGYGSTRNRTDSEFTASSASTLSAQAATADPSGWGGGDDEEYRELPPGGNIRSHK